VIFTGSSREGLLGMFSRSNAPFFHFASKLPFPVLDKKFTDHLCDVFWQVTQRKLDKNALWKAFVEMDQVPELARSLVERLVLYPQKTVVALKKQLLEEVFSDRAFIDSWSRFSHLERLLLKYIAAGKSALFSEETRMIFAEELGVGHSLPVSSIQSALRALKKKEIIGLYDRGNYFIDDPNFKTWLVSA